MTHVSCVVFPLGRILASLLPALVLLAACDNVPADGALELTFSFEESAEAWIGDFVDYPTSKTPEELELTFDRRSLPENLDESRSALFLSGRNESDDLFMYVRRKVTGLEPNTPYEVTFSLDIASNAPTGCVGIGGPPGEAVVVKVGAAPIEPVPIVEGDDYRLNIDKDSDDADAGLQSSVKQIGNIANGIEECIGEIPYQMIMLHNRGNALRVTTRDDGSLWLFVGTDSGFEGKTALYYDDISVSLTPR